jgi:hypothetical protein
VKARRPKQAPRGRVSIDDAFRRLLPALSPHGAVELMNAALRDPRRARLWCNGKVVDPGFIRTHLVVRARLMAKRRWTAEIRATRALDKPVEAYTWQTEAKQIEALKPRLSPPPSTQQDRGTTILPVTPARHTPGPKPTDDWPLLVAARLIYIARYDPEALLNAEALIEPMQKFLQEEIGWHPKDRKQVREKIVFLLKFVR